MRFIKHARVAGFVILAIVTVVGAYQFFTGDWSEVSTYWRDKVPLLPLVFLLACVDVATECVAWIWVYQRFGVRAADTAGVSACVAGRAGLLLPAQLGRLIRPDAMFRLDRGSARECLKAEAVVFVFDIASVAALLAGLAAALVHPLASVLAALAVIALLLILGNRMANLLSSTRLELPSAFWWRWQTLVIIVIQMAGWFANGAALYLLIRDLPGTADLLPTVFFAAGSSVVGAGSGLPGGLGATEGLLGASLSFMHVPAAHLALAIGGFRLLTFWIWIPIGWLALVGIKRREKRLGQPHSAGLAPVSAIS